jgi:KDO2-lipid IV(A) lauroyltransferase
MITEAGKRPSFQPANWPGWLAVGLIWLTGRLPQTVGLALSRPLGALMRVSMKRRRQVAEHNIERCFPELGAGERQAILRGCFRSLGRAVFEIAWSWSAPDGRVLRMGRVVGQEAVEALQRQGRGVLMVTAHITCLEIGGRLLGMAVPAAGIYRPLRSPVLEWYQNRGRSHYAQAMISKREMRDAIRLLRQGGVVWYAPDQDFGPGQSVFAPFFGIRTATLLATHKLARLTGCAVVPMFPAYDEARRKYTVRILPPLEDFPADDPERDLARLNAIMEAHIRQAPEQYWWIHRRFKTRPEGETPFYDRPKE